MGIYFLVIIAPNSLHGLRNKIRQGLIEDVPISRPRGPTDWKPNLPGETEQIIDSLFDAYINYLTATGYPCSESNSNKFWPVDIQICPKYILSDADPFQVINNYGSDVFRYVYLAYGDYSNSNVNQLGQLIHKCLSPKLFPNGPWVPTFPTNKNGMPDTDKIIQQALENLPGVKHDEHKWEDAKFGKGWPILDNKRRRWAPYLYYNLYPYITNLVDDDVTNKENKQDTKKVIYRGILR
ncbi:17313_t:CDS:2 [Racocetra fulgida]|uniref:17313_t:CDS:1 n=1 Tax=Racocetra fulgida TaxID=60492 RepID=A0A9N9BDK3_9GLOM|nr:17313_t:CDS:2 [Racocetra fulgida]